jgi:hypothetical protein
MANKKVSQLVSKPSVLVTDLFPIADPTTGQLFKTTISDLGTAIGSGVSSVNTLVGAVVLDTDDIQELASPTNRWFTDTRARAALSASSPLAYNSGTGVFSIAQANGSTNGFLSSADWTTFNAKQAALSGTGFVKISGTTISYDNSTYLTTSAAASTYLALAGGTLTGALNGTSATFTGDLTLSATNPRLYFTDTDNNPDYFISNTDGTFTIYDVTNSTSRLTLTNLYTTLNNTLRIQGDILLNQDSTIGPVAGYTTIASDASGIFLRLGTASSHAYLVLSGLTSFRNFTLPDATGTFALTSDLSAYLPLAGGTMSGAITTTNVYLTGMTAGSGALYYSSGSNRVTVANYNASGIIDFEVNGGTSALTLNADLSASFKAGGSFSGALSGTSASFSSTISTTGSGYFVSSTSLAMQLNGSVANDFQLNGGAPFRIVNQAYNAVLLNVTNTGAATFSSSVTATDVEATNQFITSGGNLRIVNSGGQVGMNWTSASGGDLYFRTASSPRMTITSDGNVGIGTTAPSQSSIGANRFVDLAGASVPAYILHPTGGGEFAIGSGSDGLILSAAGNSVAENNNVIRFFTATANSSYAISEKMRITSGGDLLVGSTTDNSQRIRVEWAGGAGKWGIKMNTSDGGAANLIEFLTGGSVRGSITTNGTSVAYNTTSDYRLKEDLKPINGLEIVNKIKVYDYKWKANDSRMDGVLAHELAEVLPYAVMGEKDGERMQGVDYSKIVPVMVQAIKELKAKIETLENK